MSICLMKDGATAYRIVIPARADAPTRYAAGELTRYLAMIGGVALPVVTDEKAPQGTEIVLGKADRADVPATGALKNDGYTLKTVGDTLYIAAANGRGLLYGVYGLLERHLGCRFLAAKVEKIPTRSAVTLSALDETHISPFEYREVYWYELARDQDFAVKRGMNASLIQPYDEEHGSSIRYNGFVHTFKLYIPDEEFFETHPEYFAEVNGKRQPGTYSQLCLTNPDVFSIMLERALKAIEAHPECSIISLSQNDGFNPCTCPECARIDAEEGGYAGTLIRFVNRLAREIGKVHPEILVDTLAYRQTRQPPKLTKPEPNICVRICTIECCFSHPIAECTDESNAEKVDNKATPTFQEDMDGWREMCKRMFVWDYTTNFHNYVAPFPNLHVLQDNIRYFIDHHVTGLFEQGNAQSVSGEFGELRAYLLSKLMWEPEGDVAKWTDEFLSGYYGQAAAPIAAYLKLLSRHVVENNVHVGIYNKPETYLPDALLEQAEALWNEAEAAAEDEEVLERVKKSRLQLTYVQLRRTPLSDPTRAARVAAFGEEVKHFGITHLQESVQLDRSLEALAQGNLNPVGLI